MVEYSIKMDSFATDIGQWMQENRPGQSNCVGDELLDLPGSLRGISALTPGRT